MAWMSFLCVFIVQLLIAAAVIFILKRLLDKELAEAALEKFQGLEIKGISAIIVRLGRPDLQIRSRFEELARRRFPGARLTVETDITLKGGVLIIIGEQVLDYSVADRLRNFWS